MRERGGGGEKERGGREREAGQKGERGGKEIVRDRSE